MVKKSIFIKLFICSMLIVILSISFSVSSSYASGIGDVFEDGKEFLAVGKDIDSTINEAGVLRASNYIFRSLMAVSVVVAVVVAIILGIQFMVASADEKAKVKEAMMPFVVGCVVAFGAFTIWSIAVNIMNSAEKETGRSGREEAIEYIQNRW